MKGVWETKAKCLRQDMALPPRNFTQRKSTVIKKKAASNLHHAFWVSIAAGPPLTHVVTINVTNTGLPYTKSSAAFTKLRSRKCAPWLRAEQQIRNMHPTPPTYTWSIEAPQRENFVPNLQHGRAAGCQQVRQCRNDGADRIQPVGATIERPRRLIQAHVGHQPGHAARPDIGWVADHQVERRPQRSTP